MKMHETPFFQYFDKFSLIGFEPRLSLLERLPSVGSLFALQENGTAEPDGKRAVAMAETIGHGQMQGSLII